MSNQDLINNRPTAHAFYDFGPLLTRGTMPATFVLVPEFAGTHRLQVRIYREVVDTNTRLQKVP